MPMTYYLRNSLDPKWSRKGIRVAYRYLRRRRREFNGIVCRGVSGSAFAAPLAYRLNVPLVVVRKGESTHSSYKVEGVDYADRLVFVDDFVASGNTLSEVARMIAGEKVYNYEAGQEISGFRKIVGCYLYDAGGFISKPDWAVRGPFFAARTYPVSGEVWTREWPDGSDSPDYSVSSISYDSLLTPGVAAL